MKHLKKYNENTEYYFTPEEVDHLVKEAAKIHFSPQKYLVRDKSFMPEKVKDSITFIHDKTENTITIEKWNLKNLGLDPINDMFSDILFTVLWDDLDNEDYARNYEG